jgi:hypothetical protein
MKKLLLVAVVFLSACSLVPSKWDSNQSRSITDVQLSVRHFDCNGNINLQATFVQNQVEWFDIYAQSKGTADMAKLTKVMDDTLKELVDRSSKEKVSPLYCDMKKKILVQQADIIASAVQGRF